jgi:ankyrin repeat protein
MLVRDVRVSLHAVQQETGMTAAHSAAESGSVAALRALRRFGADLAKKDKLGRLPLHVAAGMGHTTAVTELVRVLGVPVQARDALRHSALHWAAMSGHDTTVEQLVRLGAKLHSRSTTGRMALHQAAENGRASTVMSHSSPAPSLSTSCTSAGRLCLATGGYSTMLCLLMVGA